MVVRGVVVSDMVLSIRGHEHKSISVGVIGIGVISRGVFRRGVISIGVVSIEFISRGLTSTGNVRDRVISLGP